MATGTVFQRLWNLLDWPDRPEIRSPQPGDLQSDIIALVRGADVPLTSEQEARLRRAVEAIGPEAIGTLTEARVRELLAP